MLFAFLNCFPQRESLLLIFRALTPSIFSFTSISCHPIQGLNLYYLCMGTLGLWWRGCSLHPALSADGFDVSESGQKPLILKKTRPEGTIPRGRERQDALQSRSPRCLSEVVSPRSTPARVGPARPPGLTHPSARPLGLYQLLSAGEDGSEREAALNGLTGFAALSVSI